MLELVYPRGSWWERVNEQLFRQRITTAFEMASRATQGFSPAVVADAIEFHEGDMEYPLLLPVGRDVPPFTVAISDTFTLIPAEKVVETHDLVGAQSYRRSGFILWEDVQMSAGYDDPGGWEPASRGFFPSPYAAAVWIAQEAFNQSVTDTGERVQEMIEGSR